MALIYVNVFMQKWNNRHFTYIIFKCYFLNDDVFIFIAISFKYVLKRPINKTPSLVQIMDCRLFGDKPLSEPMVVCLTDVYMRHLVSIN